MKDASVLEVSDLGVSVKTAYGCEALSSAGLNNDVLTNFKFTTLHVDVEFLGTVEAKSLSGLSILELQGKDTHADKVASVNTFV